MYKKKKKKRKHNNYYLENKKFKYVKFKMN